MPEESLQDKALREWLAGRLGGMWSELPDAAQLALAAKPDLALQWLLIEEIHDLGVQIELLTRILDSPIRAGESVGERIKAATEAPHKKPTEEDFRLAAEIWDFHRQEIPAVAPSQVKASEETVKRKIAAESPFMTVKEVAEYLRYDRSWVHRMIRRGQLPAVCIGRTHRVRRTDLEHWLAGMDGKKG